jgi:C4-dicarboxylate-specific signal transduction histidine kinase
LKDNAFVAQALKSSSNFERFLSNLSSSLAQAPPAQLGRDIRMGLDRLARRARVERASLARFSEEAAPLLITHSSGAPAIPTSVRTDLPWYVEHLRQGRCLNLSRVPDDLPAEAAAEREAFRALSIRSHVSVPLVSAGRVWGVVALAASFERRWTPEEVQRLRLIGEVMAAFLGRDEAEQTTRRLGVELTHVARIASLADLTVALTHELNQPLTAIRTNAHAMQRLLAPGAPTEGLDEVLRDIVGDAARAADLIGRLATLVRRRETQKIPVELNQLVRDFQTIARVVAQRHGARLVLRLAPDLPTAVGDPVQIQQVLLNLVRNAAEAMAHIEPAGRVIDVSTSMTTPSHITVSVADSGPPVDDAALGRLFRPFDTTKPDGLGVGLVISRAIIEAHGGRVWAERRSPNGLTMHFTVLTEQDGRDGMRDAGSERACSGEGGCGKPLK